MKKDTENYNKTSEKSKKELLIFLQKKKINYQKNKDFLFQIGKINKCGQNLMNFLLKKAYEMHFKN